MARRQAAATSWTHSRTSRTVPAAGIEPAPSRLQRDARPSSCTGAFLYPLFTIPSPLPSIPGRSRTCMNLRLRRAACIRHTPGISIVVSASARTRTRNSTFEASHDLRFTTKASNVAASFPTCRFQAIDDVAIRGRIESASWKTCRHVRTVDRGGNRTLICRVQAGRLPVRRHAQNFPCRRAAGMCTRRSPRRCQWPRWESNPRLPA
jgi:hypothetical protein